MVFCPINIDMYVKWIIEANKPKPNTFSTRYEQIWYQFIPFWYVSRIFSPPAAAVRSLTSGDSTAAPSIAGGGGRNLERKFWFSIHPNGKSEGILLLLIYLSFLFVLLLILPGLYTQWKVVLAHETKPNILSLQREKLFWAFAAPLP